MRARTGRALAVIAVFVLACVAGDRVLCSGQTELGHEAWQVFASGTGTAGSESRLSDAQLGEGGIASLPEGFEEEAFSLEGCDEVRVGAEGTVIGFTVEDAAAEVLQALDDQLEQRGWAAYEAGEGTSASYVKQTGRFTWLFVSATQVGDTTSVVVWCNVEAS